MLLLNYHRKLMFDSFNEIKSYFDLINDDNALNPIDEDMLMSTYGIKDEHHMAQLRTKANKSVALGPTCGESLLLDWEGYP